MNLLKKFFHVFLIIMLTNSFLSSPRQTILTGLKSVYGSHSIKIYTKNCRDSYSRDDRSTRKTESSQDLGEAARTEDADGNIDSGAVGDGDTVEVEEVLEDELVSLALRFFAR